MPPALRAFASRLMLSSLIALTGCGGGSGDDPEGEALPMSYEIAASVRSLDVAIDGDGWFVLESDAGQRSYSRWGRLDIDRDGQLIHADGSKVVGRVSEDDASAAVLARVSATMGERATRQVRVEGTMDSETPVTQTSFVPTDLAVAGALFVPTDFTTYNNATTVEVFAPDRRAMTLYFAKMESDTWAVYIAVDGVFARQREDGIDSSVVLRFPTNGRPPMEGTIAHIPAGEAGLTQSIDVDLSGMRQWAQNFGIISIEQDGYGAGLLQRVEAQSDGHLTLHYDNGQTADGGQLLLARFTVADRLQRLGLGSWHCGSGCETPVIDIPGSTLLGSLRSQALNVKY